MSAENVETQQEAGAKPRAERKAVRGMVMSCKMDKTIVVAVERLVPHAKYRKYVRRHTKHYAHDGDNRARKGDFVELVLTRPLSKKKRWLLDSIIREAPKEAVEGTQS